MSMYTKKELVAFMLCMFLLCGNGTANAQDSSTTLDCYSATEGDETISATLLSEITTCLEQKIDASRAMSALVKQENQSLRLLLSERLDSLRIISASALCKSVQFLSPNMVIVEAGNELATSSNQQNAQSAGNSNTMTSTSLQVQGRYPGTHRTNIDCVYDGSGPGYLSAESLSGLSTSVREICERLNGQMVQASTLYIDRTIVSGFWYGSARPADTITSNAASGIGKRVVQVGMGLSFACKIFD